MPTQLQAARTSYERHLLCTVHGHRHCQGVEVYLSGVVKHTRATVHAPIPAYIQLCPVIMRPCLCTGRVFIHPGSINFDVGKFDSGWLVYTEMVATAKLYVRESSMVPIYALLLFGGKSQLLA